MLTVADIPHNDVSPTGKHDDPIFAEKTVEFHGQPIFAVVAETRDAARRAATLAKVEYKALPHVTDVAEAIAADYPFVTEPLKLERGDVASAMAAAPRRLKGVQRVGGQDHFYLEGMIAFALPGEDDDVTVYSSTQHPSEVQHMVAHVLGVPSNAVTIIVRRMGGGFGGKETQPNLFAAVAAVAAKKLGRAVKIRPDRDDDMVATGKRHDFLNEYEVGFDDDGRILAVDGSFAARCGFSADLSGPVTDRALFHADNAYFYPAVRLVSKPMKTNTVSNTAFRGFGGPQGLVTAERIMEEIAYALGKDPLEVRRANFYGDHRPQRDPLPPDRHRQRHPPHRRRAGGFLGLPGAPRSDPRPQRQGRRHPQGHRADPGQVRHQLHRHLVQPGRRPRSRLQRRLGPPEPRRHRDGPGPQHQGLSGRRRRLPDRSRPREDHRDDDGQGPEHLGDRRLLRLRPQRHGGPERGGTDQDAADRLGGGEVRGADGAGGVRAELRPGRQHAG